MADQNSGPLETEIRERWASILTDWKRGYAADESLAQIEADIEIERQEIFDSERGSSDPEKARDWRRANAVHYTNVDYVRNAKKYYDDVRSYWSQWEERSMTSLSNLSIEALRSMIIINGAAIIAALAVLSGQVSNPSPAAILVAKITIMSSISSLIMMGLGHSLIWLRVGEIATRIRSVLVGNVRHSRLRALGRYVNSHGSRITDLGNALVFSSIFVFALSASIAAIILVAS